MISPFLVPSKKFFITLLNSSTSNLHKSEKKKGILSVLNNSPAWYFLKLVCITSIIPIPSLKSQGSATRKSDFLIIYIAFLVSFGKPFAENNSINPLIVSLRRNGNTTPWASMFVFLPFLPSFTSTYDNKSGCFSLTSSFFT